MPVEIKELVIRTVVGGGPAAAQDEPDEGRPGPQPGALDAAGMDEIVQECVRQVLRVLERRQER